MTSQLVGLQPRLLQRNLQLAQLNTKENLRGAQDMSSRLNRKTVNRCETHTESVQLAEDSTFDTYRTND